MGMCLGPGQGASNPRGLSPRQGRQESLSSRTVPAPGAHRHQVSWSGLGCSWSCGDSSW